MAAFCFIGAPMIPISADYSCVIARDWLVSRVAASYPMISTYLSSLITSSAAPAPDPAALVEGNVDMVPVVLGDIAPVLHGAPAGPAGDRVLGGRPDLLAPDDVLEVEGARVVHDPFGDFGAGEIALL